MESPTSTISPATVSASPAVATAPTATPIAAPKPKRQFGIALYHAWCKHCGICGQFCPTKALVNDELGVPKVVDASKCGGCMQCVCRCPDFCVEVYEKTAPAQKAEAASRKP